MKAVCIRSFFDKKAGKKREEGEEFTVSSERFAEINSTKWGVLVEEAPQKRAAGKKAAKPVGEDE